MLKAGKRLKIVLTFLLCLGFSFLLQSSASASPQGGTVSAGQAVISQNGGTTTIQELTNSAIINWNSFNIGAGQLVQFLQPEALSAILNRVIGVDPSVIFGTLKSNGIVFLINPNGILFGQGAEIDTGSFIASTLNITNQDFLNGDYTFNQISTLPASFIVNQGTIQAVSGGSVVLLAPFVYNGGTIIANLGEIGLGAATHAVLSYDKEGLMNLVLSNPAGVPQDVTMTQQAYTAILEQVVNDKGLLPATQVIKRNGKIVLTNASGILMNAGIIEANGASNLNAGSITLNSTQATDLLTNSLISANGEGSDSNGGSITVNSQGITNFESGAEIEAEGGASGNGGAVEVSDKTGGVIDGLVDTLAPNGETGEFIIDPTNITIIDASSGGTLDPNLPNITYPTPDSGGDTVSVGALESETSNILLQAANSITIDNLTGSPANGSITLQNNVSMTMQTQTGNIVFLNPSNSIAASGTGTLTINAGTTAGSGGSAVIGNLTITAGGPAPPPGGPPPPPTIQITADGNISIGSLNGGNGSVVISSNTGSITDNTGGTATNITAPSAALTGPGGIGTDTDPVSVNLTGTLTASSTNSDILISSVGNLLLNTVNAGDGNIYITSGGEITNGAPALPPGGSPVTNLAAGAVFLEAASCIGTSGAPVTTSANYALTLETNNSSTAPIYVNDSSPLNYLTVNTNNSSSAVNFNNGAQSLSFSSGVLNANASGTSINFDNTGGNIEVGTINTGAMGSVLSASGSINPSSSSSNIASSQISLTAGAGIGTASSLPVSTSSLTATVTGAADPISISDSASLNFLNVSANNGNISISGSNGSFSFTGSGTDTISADLPGTVLYFANSGGGIENTGTGVSVVSKILNLSACSGIGTSSQPLLTQTSGGYLSANTTNSGASIFISESDALSYLVLSTNNGNVNFQDNGSSLSFTGGTTDTLSANFPKASVSFSNTGGSILNSGSSANIFTCSLTLSAASGIGTSSQPLLTQTGFLNQDGNLSVSVTGASAGIWVNETNSLVNLSAGSAGGSVAIYFNNGTQSLTFLSGVLNAAANAGGTSLFFTNTEGNIAVGTINSGASVELQAPNGAILSSSSSSSINAGITSLVAGTGIGTSSLPIVTNANVLVLDTSGGNSAPIYVNDSSTVAFLAVDSQNGNIGINFGSGLSQSISFTGTTDLLNASIPAGTSFVFDNLGNIVLNSVTGGSGSGDLTELIATDGSILGSGTGTNLTAPAVTLIANGSIGTPAAPVTASIGDLTEAEATNGGIDLSNSGNLLISSACSAGTGNNLVIQTTGNLTIGGSISAPNTAALISTGGSVIMGSGAPPVSADTAAFQAAAGIGTSADPITTLASQLTAYNTSSGGIYIDNTGNLSIDDYYFGIGSGIRNNASSGIIDITNNGSINIPLGIAGTGIFASGGGNIILDAVGSSSDITAGSGGKGTAAKSLGGNIQFTAGQDIYLGENRNNTNLFTNSCPSAPCPGTITLSAGRNITLDNGTKVVSGNGNITLTTTSGSITLQNGSRVCSQDIGNISLDAGTNLLIQSGSRICTDTKVVSCPTGNCAMNLTAADNITIDNARLISCGTGNIAAASTTGSITIQNKGVVCSADIGNISLDAGTNLLIQSGSRICTDINTASCPTGNCAMNLTAAGNITIDNARLISCGTGNIAAASTTGSITLQNGSRVCSQDIGNISLDAGTNLLIQSGSRICTDINIVSCPTGNCAMNLTAADNITIDGAQLLSCKNGSITLTAGTGGDITIENANLYSCSGGNITLTAGLNICFEQTPSPPGPKPPGPPFLSTSGNVSLTATSGDILQSGTNQAVICANILNLTAGGRVGVDDPPSSDPPLTNPPPADDQDLYTCVNTLNANISGGMVLDNCQGLTIGTVKTGSDTDIIANGSILSDGIVSSGDISLIAAGSILDITNDTQTDFTGTSVTLISGGTIGTAADPVTVNILNGSLTAAATNGGIDLSNSGNLLISSACAAGTGNNVVISATGNLTIGGSISAPNTAALISTGGSVIMGSSAPPVSANTIALQAAAGIGTGTAPITTLASQLTAYNISSGGIYINNTGNLSIDDYYFGIGYGIENTASGGVIDITNNGSMNIPLGIAETGIFASGGGNIILDAAGSTSDITAGQGRGTAAESSGTITLTAGTFIGTTTNPITTQTSSLTASASNGGIYISNTGPGSLTLGIISASGTGNNIDISNSSGSIDMGNNITGGIIALNATNTGSGSILDSSGSILTATTSLTLEGVTGIGGSGQAILSNTPSASLTTTGSNTAGIYLSDSDFLTSLSITTNNSSVGITAGNITGTLTFAGGSSGSDLLNAIFLGSNLANFSFDNTGGNIVFDSSNTLASNYRTTTVSLIASGSIRESGTSAAITANTLNLTAGTGIGQNDSPLYTKIQTLNASVTRGVIDVDNSRTLTIGTLTGANAADIAANGNLLLDGIVSSGDISLIAAGSILDITNDTQTDLTGASITLIAGGTIGTAADPVTVNILNGSLTAVGEGETNGISVNLRGTVPSNSFNLLYLNYPLSPGLVLFNNHLISVSNDYLQAVFQENPYFYSFTQAFLYQSNNSYLLYYQNNGLYVLKPNWMWKPFSRKHKKK